MAYLSEIINGAIPKEFAEEASVCCECGKKIHSGGMWAMQEAHIGICKDCSSVLLDWYIDTLLDTGIIDENDDVESVQKLSNDIIGRYKWKKQRKEKYNKNHM